MTQTGLGRWVEVCVAALNRADPEGQALAYNRLIRPTIERRPYKSAFFAREHVRRWQSRSGGVLYQPDLPVPVIRWWVKFYREEIRWDRIPAYRHRWYMLRRLQADRGVWAYGGIGDEVRGDTWRVASYENNLGE